MEDFESIVEEHDNKYEEVDKEIENKKDSFDCIEELIIEKIN